MTRFANSEQEFKKGDLIVLKISLKSARVNANLTQKEVAKKLGISNKTIGNWENGLSYPPADKINALCILYGLHYDNIIFSPKCSL